MDQIFNGPCLTAAAARTDETIRTEEIGTQMVTQAQTEGTSIDGMCPLTWSGWRDLNPRPLRPERSALPSCATPRACRAIVAHRDDRHRYPAAPTAASISAPARATTRSTRRLVSAGPGSGATPRAGRRSGRRGGVGAQARGYVQPGRSSRASGAGPWPCAGPGRSWSPGRPTPGTQTCPPWVWPASSRSKPSAAIASRTRGSGVWVTPMCRSARRVDRPGHRGRSRPARRAGRRRRPVRPTGRPP